MGHNFSSPQGTNSEAFRMANVKHYHRGSVKEILGHNERTNNYSNPDINPAKSKYNYSLSGHENDLAYYEERLSQVHCMKRANVNTLSSWVVTLPKGVKHGDQRKFFEETVEFLKNRYGAENCVGADVHFDETTPHVHFTFIPVVHDAKKNIDKVSRKELFTLKEMFSFHTDLEKHIEEKLGYKVGIRTGKTEKNLSVRELKQQTKEECEHQINNAKEAASSIVADAQKRKCEIETDCNEEYHRLMDKANADVAKVLESIADKARMIKIYELREEDIQEVIKAKTKLKKGFFGKETISIERKLAEKLLINAMCSDATSKMYNSTVEMIENLKLDEKSKEERERKIAELERDNLSYKNQNEKLKTQNDEYRSLLQMHGILKEERKRGWRR